MKRFSKLSIIAASLALLLVLAVGVRSSVAYFTSYAQSEGGETVQLVHWERFEEDVTGLSKGITITNPAYDPDNGRPTQPVFVRARAETGDIFVKYLKYYPEDNWNYRVDENGDGWWYYDLVLNPGESTTVLTAVLENIPVDPDSGAIIFYDDDGNRIGEVDQDQVNVVVYYESTLALYNYVSEGVYEPFAYWGKLDANGHTVVER